MWVHIDERATESRHGHRVLEQPAKVRVMVGLRSRTGVELLDRMTIREDRAKHPPKIRVAYAFTRRELGSSSSWISCPTRSYPRRPIGPMAST